jgi:O-antigen/teichoic acid export membrane protein
MNIYRTILVLILSVVVSLFLSLWVERNFIPIERLFYEGDRYTLTRVTSLLIFLLIPLLTGTSLNLIVNGRRKIWSGFVISFIGVAIEGILIWLLYIGLSHG